MSWKSFVRWTIPESILRLRSRRVVQVYARQVERLSLADRFTRIYATGEWGTLDGTRFFSGPGSLPQASVHDETIACAFLADNPSLSTIVDIGCGDFQVGHRILSNVPRGLSYIGCDIVPELVCYNQSKFGSPTVRFKVCDVTSAALPRGDLVLCRQVLQHLSNENVLHALERIRRAGSYALITNTVPNRPFVPNLDLPPGAHTRNALGSGLMLEEQPFLLKPVEIHQNKISSHETLRTLLVRF